MEFASLQDAFPHSPLGSDDANKKKKSKRSKEGFQAYEMPPTDAVRPALKRLDEVPPLQGPSGVADTYLDESTKFQSKPRVNDSLPSPRSTIKLESEQMPSFFGAEPFTNPSEDVMAPFNSRLDQPNGYMLESDFTKAFDQPGFGRSSGSPLPTPELRHRWKPLSADRVDTAFTSGQKSSQFAGLETGEFAAMKGRIDTLIARLDDLEDRAAGANPQLEMLSFIMTGLFLMFALDLTVKKLSR